MSDAGLTHSLGEESWKNGDVQDIVVNVETDYPGFHACLERIKVSPAIAKSTQDREALMKASQGLSGSSRSVWIITVLSALIKFLRRRGLY